MIKILWVFLFCLLPLLVSGKVIDLGELTVQGEVRKPLALSVHDEKEITKRRNQLMLADLQEFEKSLLRPIEVQPKAKP